MAALLLRPAGEGAYENNMDRAELAYQSGDYDRALRYLRQAASYDNTQECRMLMASCYERQDMFDKALEVLRTLDMDQPEVADRIRTLAERRDQKNHANTLHVLGVSVRQDTGELTLDGRNLQDSDLDTLLGLLGDALKAVPYEEKALPVVRDEVNTTETAAVRLYEDLPEVPYMSVTDFYNRFYLAGTDLSEGMSFTRDGGVYTLTNFCGDKAVFDVNNDTIVIDNVERNHKLGLVFEATVGKGKLLVCASDLDSVMEYPEGRAFRSALMDYMLSQDFAPKTSIIESDLISIVK